MVRSLSDLVSPAWFLFGSLACSSPEPAKPPTLLPTPGTAVPLGDAAPDTVGPELGSAFEVDASEPLPKGAVARLGTTKMRVGHVEAITITDSGKIWAVDEAAEHMVLRDVGEGADVKSLPSSRQWVIAPDARWVAGASPSREEGTITFYEVPSARVLGSVTVPLAEHSEASKSGKPRKFRGSIVELKVAADGLSVVASTSDGEAHVIDAATFKRLKTIKVPHGMVLSSLSANGKRALFLLIEDPSGLAPGSSQHGPFYGYLVVDLSTGATIRKEMFKAPAVAPTQHRKRHLLEHGEAAYGISMDGKKLYRSEAGELAAIDVATGVETSIRPRSSDAPSPRGEELVLLADGERAIANDELMTLDGTTERKLKGRFYAASPDSKTTVEGQWNRLSRSPDGPAIRQGADSRVDSLTFLPDGRTLVASDGEPRFWDTLTGKPKPGPEVKASIVLAARRKPSLFIAGSEGLVIDEKGQMKKLELGKHVSAAAFSADASRLFVGLGDEYDKSWELVSLLLAAGGKPQKSRSFPSLVHHVAIADDGSALVVSIGRGFGPAQSAIEIVDPATLATTKRIEVDDAAYVAFAGDKIVEASEDGRIRLRSKDSLEEVGRIGSGRCCSTATVSPNGKLVAGSIGRSVRVWDIETRKLVGTARGHREEVESVAFSPDSRFLATGSRDTSVLLWKVDALPGQTPRTTPEALSAAEAARVFGHGSSALRIGPRGTLEKVNASRTENVPPLKGVEKVVSMGLSHCALSRGKVQCWGHSRGGALGIAEERDAQNHVVRKEQPVTVAGVKNAVDLFGAGDYACALEKSFDLICWGRLDYSSPGASPTKILSGVKTLSIGTGRACALDFNGTATCWTGRESPAAVPIKDVTGLALGNRHACFVDKEGKVRCLGMNDSDQLGDGSGVTQTQPVLAVGLDDAISVYADGEASCAVTKKKEVYCWGRLPEPGSLPTPGRVADLDGSTELVIERRRVCGHIGGKAVCVKFEED